MKKTLLLASVWLQLLPVTAQKIIERHINFSGKESVSLDIQIADSVIIHTWKKTEVYARASVNIDNNEKNEVYITSFDESGKKVGIKAFFEEKYLKEKNHCCDESMIVWELYLPENTPFDIETINGNITIDGVTSEIMAKSISGFIDWKVMPGCNADLELKTISGTFYSDMLTVSGTKNDNFPPVLTHKINKGGTPVTLETISGDIYCRK